MSENTLANVLVVGDPKKGAMPVLQASSVHDIEVNAIIACTLKEAIQQILEKPIDIIITEYSLDDGTALELLEALSQLMTRMIPVVVLANENNEKMGIQIFRKGAKDFLIKDKAGYYLQRLPLTIERVLKEEVRYRENSRIRKNSEAILATISDGVVGLSLEGIITFANPMAAMYLKSPFESLREHPIDEFVKRMEDLSPKLKVAMKDVKATNETVVIGQYIVTFDEQVQSFFIKISLIPVFNELMHLDGFVLSLTDTTPNKPSNKIAAMGVQDDLTGLMNRKAFFHRLEQGISYCNRYQSQCAVLFIDIDGFKAINDALGHHYGDELLQKITARIQSVIREADIISRVGGDEFMVLLTHINQANDAGVAATKINQILLSPFLLSARECYITASIGIAIYPNDGIEADKLMQFADFAMSLAKKQGKNRYHYYQSDLNIEAERAMIISNDLRLAIANNELDLHFHPQICAKTGNLSGLEALLRWHHPQMGMIPPVVFIPIAEETGYISTLGKWVFDKACQCCMKWEKEGLNDFTISINLSIKEMRHDDFLDSVVETISRYQVKTKRLQFEITESIFAHDTQVIIEKLKKLKGLGFQIAMDDFGTGYSCLSYLRDLPIDVIKIDRSFVHALEYPSNERHRAIISAIIDLAKRLNITTLAEGVETKEEAEFLRAIGCEQLQGFLIAKPMPYEMITEFIQKRVTTTGWQRIYNSK